MPGIVGLISDKNYERLFEKMLDKLNHYDYKIEKYMKNGINLGKVHLSYVNKSSQPIMSKDNNYAIIMIGEIFSYENLETEQIKNDAEFLLNIFIEKGVSCLPKINGQYSASIYDFIENKLILISDRLGTHPVYYTHHDSVFFFAPEIKSLILGSFNKKINYDAISDLFHFGHLLEYKTMFKNIHQLPESSYLIYQDNKIEIKKYWDYPFYEKAYNKQKISIRETENYIEELQDIMALSLKRQITKNKDDILYSLSGGLDSRWVISLASKLIATRPLTAFTMGESNSEDIIYAKMIALNLQLNHYTYKISPFDVWKNAKEFSYVSDAMSMINGPIQIIEPSRVFFKKQKITLSSQMCDALFGSTLQRRKIKKIINKEKFDNESENIVSNIFKIHDEDTLVRIFSKSFFHKIKNSNNTTYKYIEKYKKPIHSYFMFLINEHVRRGTLGGNIANNLFYETRMPSFDNDLLDFAFKLPIDLKKNQFIYRQAFNRLFPEIAAIPREGTGLPIDSSELRLNMRYLENKIVIKLQATPFNKIIKKINRWNRPDYVSYGEWFKNELKHDVENIVLDNRTISRGIFNENGLRKLLTEHNLTKKDNSRLIWQIINIEYFFRNFVD